VKFQTPTIGGVRKIIRTPPATTVGTTIAEIGAGTITLAQLAAAISQLQAQQNNNGGGNIGPSGIFIETGPGLGGGGGGGVVNLRLTAPIPVFTGDDGADGDIGPPGIAGKAGATGAGGPIGPAVFMLADDGDPGEQGPPGATGPAGATGTGTTGATGPAGPALHILANDTEPDNDQWCLPAVPNTVSPFNVNGPLTIYGGIIGTAVTGNTLSLYNTGSAITNAPLYLACGASDYLANFSDGINTRAYMAFDANHNLQFGGTNLAGQTYGFVFLAAGATTMYVLTTGVGVIGAISCNAATPAPVAGLTAIGVSTTATVITTAGGIALPALASTFWKVNVNGVAYGIPCFAL